MNLEAIQVIYKLADGRVWTDALAYVGAGDIMALRPDAATSTRLHFALTLKQKVGPLEIGLIVFTETPEDLYDEKDRRGGSPRLFEVAVKDGRVLIALPMPESLALWNENTTAINLTGRLLASA